MYVQRSRKEKMARLHWSDQMNIRFSFDLISFTTQHDKRLVFLTQVGCRREFSIDRFETADRADLGSSGERLYYPVAFLPPIRNAP